MMFFKETDMTLGRKPLKNRNRNTLHNFYLKQSRFHEEYSGSVARLGVGGFGVVHLVHDRFYFCF